MHICDCSSYKHTHAHTDAHTHTLTHTLHSGEEHAWMIFLIFTFEINNLLIIISSNVHVSVVQTLVLKSLGSGVDEETNQRLIEEQNKSSCKRTDDEISPPRCVVLFFFFFSDMVDKLIRSSTSTVRGSCTEERHHIPDDFHLYLFCFLFFWGSGIWLEDAGETFMIQNMLQYVRVVSFGSHSLTLASHGPGNASPERSRCSDTPPMAFTLIWSFPARRWRRARHTQRYTTIHNHSFKREKFHPDF